MEFLFNRTAVIALAVAGALLATSMLPFVATGLRAP